MQSKNTLKTVLACSEAEINHFLCFWTDVHDVRQKGQLKDRNFCYFLNLLLFLTGVWNFTFEKIFNKFCKTFGGPKLLFSWNSFGLLKTGKTERPGKPKGQKCLAKPVPYFTTLYINS